MAKRDAADASNDTTTADATEAATAAASAMYPPKEPAPKEPPSSVRTNSYAFAQAVEFCARTARLAPDLVSLRQHLDALATDARNQVATMDQAEKALIARLGSVAF